MQIPSCMRHYRRLTGAHYAVWTNEEGSPRVRRQGASSRLTVPIELRSGSGPGEFGSGLTRMGGEIRPEAICAPAESGEVWSCHTRTGNLRCRRRAFQDGIAAALRSLGAAGGWRMAQ